ncbi:dihydrolipoyl dehydrogenase, partial [Streptomyces sp. WAC04770]
VVVDSTGALELPKVPEHLVVIGGGVIGLELGSVWRRVGARVTVVEFLDQLLPGMDGEVRKEAGKLFKKQGMDIRTATGVEKIDVTGTGVKASIKGKDGKVTGEEFSHVIVAVGIVPNTENIGLETLGVKTERGHIVTDAACKTNVPGLYAIGDVTAPPFLAHKAS